MDRYNPFDEDENPFESIRDPLLEENIETNSSTYLTNKNLAISVLSLVVFVGLFNFLSNKSISTSAIEEKSEQENSLIIDDKNKTVVSPSTTTSTSTSTTTTTTLPNLITEKRDTPQQENNLILETNNPINQNLIIEKTVQVVAENCGLGPDDRESWTNVGSGVLISSDGHLISNSHVIEDCYGEIYIATTKDADTPTEIQYIAEIVQQSKSLDLVLLKIVSTVNNEKVSKRFNYFELADTEQLQLGETINIWGFPTARGNGYNYQLKINLTKGTISGFESDYQKTRGWIITDADITYGNSGGAGLDNFGRLVGVPTQGVTEGTSWIGYLRSVDVIKAWIQDSDHENVISTSHTYPNLVIQEHDLENTPKYYREDWNTWIDEDGDCQNTRHENLILESSIAVSFTNQSYCYVDSGQWFDPYNGQFIFSASELDVDHFIPLYNAHLSGAWSWNIEKKTEFANSLEDPDMLIAVKSITNREKSAFAPDYWKPPNQKYWCEYAYDWIRIKYEWELTVTQSEWNALMEMISTCPEDFLYSDAKNSRHLFSESKISRYQNSN